MNTIVRRALVQEKAILRKLLQLYCYDFSEILGIDLNEVGEFEYRWLDYYWNEEQRIPFLLHTDGKISGMVFVRREEDAGIMVHSIAEFFILRKYRKKGVGYFVAETIFDQFEGIWKVSVLSGNTTAVKFWEKTISRYTFGKYTIETREDWSGPVYEFESRKRHLTS